MLYLAEYTDIGSAGRGAVPIPMEPAIASQTIEVSASSAQSTPFDPATCLVSLVADEDIMLAVGKDPDAARGRIVKAGVEKVISIPAGSGLKVAVMAANSGSVTGMDSLESLVKLLASPDDAQKQYAVMKSNADKMAAVAADLRKDTEENRAIHDQLVQATQEALAAKAAAEQAAGDVAVRESALDRDMADHADKVKADEASATILSDALDAKILELSGWEASINKKDGDLSLLAANLDAREKELKAREDAAAALQADYEARVAKFKALAS